MASDIDDAIAAPPVYSTPGCIPENPQFHIHNSFAFWLSRLNSVLQESFNQQLKDYDISWSQWQVLNILMHNMADTPASIAQCMGVDRSAVTRLLDRLEDKGYTQRIHDRLDRRSVKVSMTESGRSRVSAINQQAYRHQCTFLADLHRSEKRGLKGELQKILRTVGIETSQQWHRAE